MAKGTDAPPPKLEKSVRHPADGLMPEANVVFHSPHVSATAWPLIAVRCSGVSALPVGEA